MRVTSYTPGVRSLAGAPALMVMMSSVMAACSFCGVGRGWSGGYRRFAGTTSSTRGQADRAARQRLGPAEAGLDRPPAAGGAQAPGDRRVGLAVAVGGPGDPGPGHGLTSDGVRRVAPREAVRRRAAGPSSCPRARGPRGRGRRPAGAGCAARAGRGHAGGRRPRRGWRSRSSASPPERRAPRRQTKQGRNPVSYSASYSSVDRTKPPSFVRTSVRGSAAYAGGSPNRLTSLRR